MPCPIGGQRPSRRRALTARVGGRPLRRCRGRPSARVPLRLQDQPQPRSRGSMSRIPRGGPEGRTPHRRILPKALSPITDLPCPAWATMSSYRRSPMRRWSRRASGCSAGSATISRSRRNVSHRTCAFSTGGRSKAMSISPARSASSCAGASISPRMLISTCGNSSRNARTRRGSTEYVADPTHPMVR